MTHCLVCPFPFPVEVRVEFDYDAELVDELSLRVGDVITDVKQMEGGWWTGTLNGKTGLFPDNFVKVRTEQQSERRGLDPRASGQDSWLKETHMHIYTYIWDLGIKKSQ